MEILFVGVLLFCLFQIILLVRYHFLMWKRGKLTSIYKVDDYNVMLKVLNMLIRITSLFNVLLHLTMLIIYTIYISSLYVILLYFGTFITNFFYQLFLVNSLKKNGKIKNTFILCQIITCIFLIIEFIFLLKAI